MKTFKISLVAVLLSLFALAIPLQSELVAQEETPQNPQFGYATGNDVLHVIDLDNLTQDQRIFGQSNLPSLTSPPKFGPNNRIYIADGTNNGLNVYDIETRAILDDEFIDLPASPNDFEILGSNAIVTDFNNSKIRVVDLNTGEVTQEADIDGPAANEIAIAPNGLKLYVTTYDFTASIPYPASHPVVAFEILQLGDQIQLIPSATIPLDDDFGGEIIPYVASSVDVSSDNSKVYVLAVNDFGEEPQIFVIDALTNTIENIIFIDLGLRARDPFVNVLTLSTDDKTIGVAAFNNGLALVDVETEETRVLELEDDMFTAPSVVGVTFGPDPSTVYAIGNQNFPLGFIVSFDVETGAQTGVLTLRNQALLFMAIPGGKTF
jgi:DNA-binding beta-propeller fold protein YncE